MKKLFALIVIVALTISIFAQPPQKMSYQAVIRNSSGQLVTNHTVGMRISILQGSATGTPVYIETQTPITNANGLVTIEIGGGTVVTGTFAGINWSTGTYFVKTETDPNGGTSYTITGTSQLLSVPYALYSKTAGNSSLWSQSGSNIYYSSGNVGIGVSDPTNNLDVRGSNLDDDGVVQLGNSDLSHRLILFGGRQSDPNPFINWKQGDPLRFTTDEGGWSEKMRITSDGKVGIGTNTPGSKLEVAGQIKITGGTPAVGQVLTSDGTGLATWEPPAGNSSHYIGESYGGGIVFYVYDNGQHGLITANADQSTAVVWTNTAFQSTVSNAVRDGINGGLANTERIIIQAGAGSYAAQLCANYKGGNYADWYLPSKYELNLLYLQKSVVGGFANSFYWSSTELNDYVAWVQAFDSGGEGATSKDGADSVRAVRAF
jgi:hypothetical protein